MAKGGVSLAAILIGAGLLLGRPGGARAEDAAKPPSGVADLRGSHPLSGPSQDQVVYKGTAVPGVPVTIGVDGTIPAGTTFHWKQVEGPPVAIDDPSAVKIRFTVPIDAKRLAFVATVADGLSSRDVRVTVPIAPAPVAATVPIMDEGSPVADSGDDQIGLAGRRITLNGSRSRPQGGVGFRWMHLSGPAISDARQEGPYFTFVPTAPGLYRFALVVGYESKVSMPSMVTVEVGQLPGVAAASVATPEQLFPLTRWARSAIAPIPGGEETSAQVGDVFEAIASRAALYTSFSQLQSELTRRLDVVVPAEPAIRNLWSSQVFVPLSQMTSWELMAVGIDLRVPSAADRPLESSQRERIGAFYRSLAVAFRPRPAKP